jgi:hypothetical protein
VHRWRLDPHCHSRHGNPQRGRRDHRQTCGSGRSRSTLALVRAGNAGVVARSGRLFRRDDEERSESYPAILGRAGLTEIEARGKMRTERFSPR